ncbi:MAG: hypothetical protein PHV42_04395 [Candidatus Pacebacteria bacterium]|nr:hypothetical protein [Candidatus Paceibacterota bacterium]
MDTSDLVAINRYLAGIIKQNRKIENSSKAFEFQVGDHVSFENRGCAHTGSIIKVKNIKAIVETEFGHHWDVPFRMLTKTPVCKSTFKVAGEINK